MMKRTPALPGTSPPLFFTGYLYILSALGGLLAAVLVFLLLTYASYNDRQGKIRDFSLQGLVSARESMEESWDQADFWVEQMAWQLGAATRESIPTLLARHQRLWPNVGFSLFDANANLITDLTADQSGLSSGRSISDQQGLRRMVRKALDGETSRDYTVFRGFLSLGVTAPVQGNEVRALVLSMPLDPLYLRMVKRVASADLAVALLDEPGENIHGDLSNTGSVFSSLTDRPDGLRAELNNLLKHSRLKGGTPFLLQDKDFSAGLELLVNAQGMPVGMLLASPQYKPPSGFHIWHVYASAIFGILVALILGFFLRFREKRMANAVAADMYGLARDMEAEPQNNWPPALNGAFRKMAESMEEYRVLLENAHMKRPEPRDIAEKTEERACESADAEYQRLFDSLPVGAFRTTADGRFLKVNLAFALLLGYESPMNLVAECGSFENICLYGEGLRNPLGMIAEKGAGRHILSLRRRDGAVRHFAVICTSVTSPTGDDAGILEGFLIDRELEDKLSAVERESLYAKQERESLARLLAATCRQTQSYFQPFRPKPQPQGETANALTGQNRADTGQAPLAVDNDQAPPWPEFKLVAGQIESGPETPEEQEERLERRKSVLSIKAVLNDIYQIAITEAEDSAPVLVPMEFLHFLKQLCRQALPTLLSRGISLRCEIADNLPLRMSGPAPVLRHALLRSLLAVTAPARGGWACLNVMNDPNAPSVSNVSRLLFSISWSPSSYTPENQNPHSERETHSEIMHTADDGFTIFVAEAEGSAPRKDVKDLSSSLDLPSEQDVIRFLTRKMRGDLLDGVFTDKLRSVQIVVPLDHLCDVADDCRIVASEKSAEGTIDLNPDPAQPENTGDQPPRVEEQIEIRRIGREAPLATLAGIDEADIGSVDLERELEGQVATPSLNLLVIDPDSPVEQAGQDEVFDKDEILESDSPVRMPSLDILLVDASLNNRMLFSMYLKDTSHRISEAHDGQEGVEYFQRGKYDIIFMDMEMPLMDGYQATRIIRALEADNNLPPTPIVGMTSYPLPELRRECLLAGCTEFLSRPISKNALLTLLRAFAGLKNDGEPAS